MTKTTFTRMITLVLTMTVALATPAGAITDGELDGEEHPYVVLLLVEIGGTPAFRCSGTLLSPTVLLTAGQCVNNTYEGFTSGEISGMRVFTESDIDNGNNNYPFAGPNSVEADAWFAHPDFATAPPEFHDVGVVVLQTPGVSLPTYGELPELDQLDAFSTKRGRQDTTFTAVGYGRQQSNPVFIQADRVRMKAIRRLLQINTPGFTGDFSLQLSNNPSTGGTCFGDEGGPNFLGASNIVAGVTSFGLNGNCAGTGGAFRMDRANVLDFVNSFLE